METASGWWSGVQRSSTFVVVLGAAVLTALYMTNDTHVMQNLIKLPEDPFSAAAAYLTVGGWLGLSVNWLFCQTPLGRVIDPSFKRIEPLTWRGQIPPLVAGAIGALTTLFLLLGSQIFDPSLLLPLEKLAILFVAGYEAATGLLNWRKLWVPVLLVVGGGALFSFSPTTGVFISAVGLGVLVLRGIVQATAEILERKGVLICDAASFAFWRFFWLTIVGTATAVTASLIRGTFSSYTTALLLALHAWLWIVLTMVMVFFGMGLKTAAKKYIPVTHVMMLMTLPVVLGIPITFAINLFWPGTFATAPMNYVSWLFRLGGAVLILFGLIRLQQLKAD